MSEHHFHRDDDRLDELFRQSLGDMQATPSEKVWRKVNRRLLTAELLRLKVSNLPKIFWGIIPAALLVGSLFVLDFSQDEPAVTTVSAVTQELTVISIAEATDTPIPSVVTTTLQPEQPIALTAADAGSRSGSLAASGQTETNTASESSRKPSEDAPHLPIVETADSRLLISETTDSRLLHSSANLPLLIPAGTDQTLNPVQPAPILEPLPNPVPVIGDILPVHPPLARSLDLGLNITPEMIFYEESSGAFKYNYTFDAGVKYNIGRFYLESGLGVTLSSAIGNYAISYLKNDSVGYYYTISSYEPGPGGEPQFETKQVTVYDSVEYLQDESTKNHYTYLNIPLKVGYRILNHSRWSLSAEAGIFYTNLVSAREPAPAFFMEESRILDIQSLTPGRNKHAYGITAGIGLDVMFARNLYLHLEPSFRYYIQAIDESSARGNRQPYSLGLRAGIWYRLNIKHKTK